MNRRSDHRPTTQALVSLRQIPKNVRTRQSTFNEQLQAKLEEMSQNWKTYFSQSSSSSSSSQNWWQHEHQDTQLRGHQDSQDHHLFQGVSLTGNCLGSDWECRPNTLSHAHFSQSSCRSCLSTFSFHTHMRVAQDVRRSRDHQ